MSSYNNFQKLVNFIENNPDADPDEVRAQFSNQETPQITLAVIKNIQNLINNMKRNSSVYDELIKLNFKKESDLESFGLDLTGYQEFLLNSLYTSVKNNDFFRIRKLNDTEKEFSKFNLELNDKEMMKPIIEKGLTDLHALIGSTNSLFYFFHKAFDNDEEKFAALAKESEDGELMLNLAANADKSILDIVLKEIKSLSVDDEKKLTLLNTASNNHSTAFAVAVKDNKIAKVEEFLNYIHELNISDKQKFDAIANSSDKDEPILFYPARKGNVNVLKLLLNNLNSLKVDDKEKFAVVMRKNKFNFDGLKTAVNYNKPEVIQLIAEFVANLDLPENEIKNYKTHLYELRKQAGNKETKQMLNEAERLLFFKDKFGKEAYDLIVAKESVEDMMPEQLLTILTSENKNNETPFYWAENNNSAIVARKIFEKMDALKISNDQQLAIINNPHSKYGFSPLVTSARHGNTEMVKHIVDKLEALGVAPDAITKQFITPYNDKGETILNYIAGKMDCTDVLNFVLDRIENLSPEQELENLAKVFDYVIAVKKYDQKEKDQQLKDVSRIFERMKALGCPPERIMASLKNETDVMPGTLFGKLLDPDNKGIADFVVAKLAELPPEEQLALIKNNENPEFSALTWLIFKKSWTNVSKVLDIIDPLKVEDSQILDIILPLNASTGKPDRLVDAGEITLANRLVDKLMSLQNLNLAETERLRRGLNEFKYTKGNTKIKEICEAHVKTLDEKITAMKAEAEKVVEHTKIKDVETIEAEHKQPSEEKPQVSFDDLIKKDKEGNSLLMQAIYKESFADDSSSDVDDYVKLIHKKFEQAPTIAEVFNMMDNAKLTANERFEVLTSGDPKKMPLPRLINSSDPANVALCIKQMQGLSKDQIYKILSSTIYGDNTLLTAIQSYNPAIIRQVLTEAYNLDNQQVKTLLTVTSNISRNAFSAVMTSSDPDSIDTFFEVLSKSSIAQDKDTLLQIINSPIKRGETALAYAAEKDYEQNEYAISKLIGFINKVGFSQEQIKEIITPVDDEKLTNLLQTAVVENGGDVVDVILDRLINPEMRFYDREVQCNKVWSVIEKLPDNTANERAKSYMQNAYIKLYSPDKANQIKESKPAKIDEVSKPQNQESIGEAEVESKEQAPHQVEEAMLRQVDEEDIPQASEATEIQVTFDSLMKKDSDANPPLIIAIYEAVGAFDSDSEEEDEATAKVDLAPLRKIFDQIDKANLSTEEKFEILNNSGDGGLTPLISAAYSSPEVLEILMNRVEDLPQTQKYMLHTAVDNEGTSALSAAIQSSHVNSVRKLLKEMEEFDKDQIFEILMKPDNKGNTPIMYAIESSNREINKALLNCLDKISFDETQKRKIVQKVNSKGQSLFNLAVKSNKTTSDNFALQWMFDFTENIGLTDGDKFEFIRANEHYDNSLISKAIKNNNINALQLILEKVDELAHGTFLELHIIVANPDGESLRSPLGVAVSSNNVKATQVLLDYLEPNENAKDLFKDNREISFFVDLVRTSAIAHSDGRMVNTILNFMDNVPLKSSQREIWKNGLAECAKIAKTDETRSRINQSIEKIENWEKLSQQINDYEGTVLHLLKEMAKIQKSPHEEEFKLIDEIKGKKPRMPLDYRKLFNIINQRDEQGDTMLINLARWGRIDTMEKLIVAIRALDVSNPILLPTFLIENNAGETALSIAKKRGNKDIENLLTKTITSLGGAEYLEPQQSEAEVTKSPQTQDRQRKLVLPAHQIKRKGDKKGKGASAPQQPINAAAKPINAPPKQKK